MDFFEQMKFLHGHFLGETNWWQFRAKFFRQCPWAAYDWQLKPGAAVTIKAEIHHRAFILSRKAAGVSTKAVFALRFVRLTPAARIAYDRVESDFILTGKQTAWRVVVDSWLGQIAGGYPKGTSLHHHQKRNELTKILTGELLKDKVVVWFRFNKELRECKRHLRKQGIICKPLTGRTSLRKRALRLSRFTKKSGIRVL